jgi:hypothetical protein
MGEMKSAWEKAMEKAEKLGKPTPEELKQLEYIPAGNAIAARFLQEEKYDLAADLAKHKGSGAGQYVIQGAQEIFLRNINLPHNENDKKIASRAMAGIRLLKEDKKQLDAVYELINNLLSYYDQARQLPKPCSSAGEIRLIWKSRSSSSFRMNGAGPAMSLTHSTTRRWKSTSSRYQS